jgi:hypothetical protein
LTNNSALAVLTNRECLWYVVVVIAYVSMADRGKHTSGVKTPPILPICAGDESPAYQPDNIAKKV